MFEGCEGCPIGKNCTVRKYLKEGTPLFPAYMTVDKQLYRKVMPLDGKSGFEGPVTFQLPTNNGSPVCTLQSGQRRIPSIPEVPYAKEIKDFGGEVSIHKGSLHLKDLPLTLMGMGNSSYASLPCAV